jgi:DNA-binding LacI/PurR family transcriptional regulator
MTSLRKVAERAGVSVATASRVASGSAPVSAVTRQRVERAMRELLYVPPKRPAASGVIGLLLPELSNPVFPAFAQAMEARATTLGFASIVCNTAGSPSTETEYVHMLLEHRVDGMIFISCEMADLKADHTHYAALVAKGARLVFVNGSVGSFAVPAVGVDERSAGFLATEHLIGLGHRRIGFVAGPAYYVPTRDKGVGRSEALAAAGLPDGLVAHGEFNVEGGRKAFRELWSRAADERPTAVICSNDLMAIGTVLEAAELGLEVPRDVSVVGFDGIDAATWLRPSLTTVEQPIRDIAETAVDALQSLIRNPERPLPDFVFRPRLRIAASTAPPAKESA